MNSTILHNYREDKKWSLWMRMFHWTTVLLLIIVYVYMGLHEKTDDANSFYISMHKAVGVTIFFWTIFRLMVRWANKNPPQLFGPRWQAQLASFVHIGLYLALLLMPFTGFLTSEFANKPINMFGLFEIPVFVDPNRKVARFFHELHGDVIWPAFVALILLHIGGALYHQYVKKDGLIRRMM